MSATGYFDRGDARAEVEILKDQVIVTKYKRVKRVLRSMANTIRWPPLIWV